jgi:uncharacterized protein YeeX (DUF496 family)
MALTQRSLEEYITNLESVADVQSLVIALINSAYELNSLIPNAEKLFFNMFCSPLTTKEARAGGKDCENPLFGNIFADKGVSMTYLGYKSLLESLLLDPKKKHLKKVIAHIKKFETKATVDPLYIDLIASICIAQDYPVLLGVTMKYFMQNDYPIPKRTFQNFVLFLERCKGYEEDAKKFVFMTSETETLDFSYDLVRPLFRRNMELKSGNDVLQLFEQVRKNIRLNRTTSGLTQAEKSTKLQEKKREFYDGLLKDLIVKKAYALAEIVYGEKMKEKFEQSVADQIIGLEIFASQKKIDDFNEIFTKLTAEVPKAGTNEA